MCTVIMTEKLLHGKRIGCHLLATFVLKVLSSSISSLGKSRLRYWDKDEISHIKIKIAQCIEDSS